jgi:hypothetical protein
MPERLVRSQRSKGWVSLKYGLLTNLPVVTRSAAKKAAMAKRGTPYPRLPSHDPANVRRSIRA